MYGKVAIVTGGSKGLGRLFTENLLKRGAQVLFGDVDEIAGVKTLHQLQMQFGNDKCAFVKCDVTKESDQEEMFKKALLDFKRINVVVNNAGILNETDWEIMIQTNVMGTIRGTKLGLKYMGFSNGGQGGVVVNIASAAGLTFVPFAPAYTASKHSIVAFSKSMALHPSYLLDHVRINCLCPFYVNNDMVNNLAAWQVLGYEIAQMTVEAVGKISPEDVLEGFVDLTKNEYLNGECLVITKDCKKLATFPKTGFEALTEKEV